TLLCSFFSVSNGGAFFCLLPQVRSVQHIVGGSPYGVGSWGWIVNDARVFAPIVIGAIAAVVCASMRRSQDAAWRFTVASGVYVLGSEAFLFFWDLAFSGTTLQFAYYFSLLLPAMTMCMGGVAGLLL